jgi:peptide subunit release factor 1 (eRF1)
MIVSCYADTSPAAGFQSFWSWHLKNEFARIDQSLADDAAARRRLARDVAVIRRTLSSPAAQRARGMAIFSAADRGLFQSFALGVPVKDCLVVDEQPYLVPLLQTMHRQRRYLVVLTDSHRGRIYAAGWGRAKLLVALDEAVPKRQRSSGELWGKQQATIERHREDHILHYRNELVRAIGKAWDEEPFRGLILLGEHETLAALRAALPDRLAGRVIHDGPRAWVGRQPSLDAQVRAVLDEALCAHDFQLVDELHRRLREHHYVAAGPQEVVDALRNGQVLYNGYVVLVPDRGDVAARCTGCGSVFAAGGDRCAYCGAACAKVSLWQEILLFAARHNITVHTVDAASPELVRHGGVAAVLSREAPWPAAVPAGAAAGVESP